MAGTQKGFSRQGPALLPRAPARPRRHQDSASDLGFRDTQPSALDQVPGLGVRRTGQASSGSPEDSVSNTTRIWSYRDCGPSPHRSLVDLGALLRNSLPCHTKHISSLPPSPTTSEAVSTSPVTGILGHQRGAVLSTRPETMPPPPPTKAPRVAAQKPGVGPADLNANSYPDFGKALSGFGSAKLPIIDLDTGTDRNILVSSRTNSAVPEQPLPASTSAAVESITQSASAAAPRPLVGNDAELYRSKLCHFVREMQQVLEVPTMPETDPVPSLENLCAQMEELVEFVRHRTEGPTRSPQWPANADSLQDPSSGSRGDLDFSSTPTDQQPPLKGHRGDTFDSQLLAGNPYMNQAARGEATVSQTLTDNPALPAVTRGESSSQGPRTYHPIPQSPGVSDEPKAPNSNSGRIPPGGQLRSESSNVYALPDRSRSGDALQSNLSMEPHLLAPLRQSTGSVSMVSRDSLGTMFHVPSLVIAGSFAGSSTSSLGPCPYLPGDVLAARNVRRSDFEVVYDPAMTKDREHVIRCAAGPLYMEGSLLEGWEFLPNGELGQGASGKVKKAARIGAPDQLAAVKIMEKSRIDYKYVAREIFSFRISSGTQFLGTSTNVVNLYEVYEDKAKIYLVMELLSGGPLFRRISQRAHSEQECARIARMMLSALAYLHRLNITHRDIKPENFVFCTSEENADLKLTDFGISSYHDDPHASMKTMLGTPLYVAPEVFGRQPYGPEVDLWAIGVVVYQMLVGHPPFDHTENIEIVSKVKYDPVTFDGKEWLCVSEAGKNFCARLLEKDPRKRPSAEMALHDDWILREGSLTDNKLNAAQENIMSYLSRQRWKKVGNAIDAANKFVAVVDLTDRADAHERQRAKEAAVTSNKKSLDFRKQSLNDGPTARPAPAVLGTSRSLISDDKIGSSRKKGLFSCFSTTTAQ